MEFRILGPLEALADGVRLPLGGPKQRTVLASLLLHANAAVAREQLLDAVWGEQLPETAVATLQVYVHGLRRALGGDRIETAGTAYRVRVEPDELDLDRFELLVERARRQLADGRPEAAARNVEAALALWRGPALADLAERGDGSTPARDLEERRLDALELRNDVQLALGRPDLVLSAVDEQIAQQPFRERLRAQQILALYRASRQTEALAAYASVRRVWSEELGLEPTPQLRELERLVLRHDPSLAGPAAERPPAIRLPAPATLLVGRKLEIAAVTALLREDARLVTLLGPGGTGKTRLAIAVAETLAPEQPDGAVFVDLSAVLDPDLLLPAVAEALELDETRNALAGLGEQLRDRACLLVLDNLEQIVAGAAGLSKLLAAAPRVRILATSRAPLRVSHEHEYPVPPLPLPMSSEPEELAQNEAVRLFAARARAVDPAFRVDERTGPAVAAICRRLDGLPLALELAAARVKLLPVGDLLARLEDRHDVLADAPRDAPARQSTIAATIEWSYGLLAEPERAAFARLAVFVGGCTLAAAEQVSGAGLETLAALVDHSLLQRRHDAVQPRLAMLETVRRFALERLDEHGADEARGRHADWLTELAEESERRVLGGDDPAVVLDEIAVEHDNVRAALAWALDAGAVDVALRLAAALRPFWDVRGHLEEGRRWLEEALADGGEAPAEIRAKAVSVAGTLAFHGGRLDVAETRFGESLELFRRVGDANGAARSLSDLGTVAAALGDLPRATEQLEQSAAEFRRLGEQKRLAVVLANLGHVAGQAEDYERAASVTREALAIQVELGDRLRQAVSLVNLGSFAVFSGELTEARRWFEECLSLALELDYREVLAYALVGLTKLCLLESDPLGTARLAGAADAVLVESGVALLPVEAGALEQAKASAREQLGDDGYSAAYGEGQAASVRDALAAAGLLSG